MGHGVMNQVTYEAIKAAERFLSAKIQTRWNVSFLHQKAKHRHSRTIYTAMIFDYIQVPSFTGHDLRGSRALASQNRPNAPPSLHPEHRKKRHNRPNIERNVAYDSRLRWGTDGFDCGLLFGIMRRKKERALLCDNQTGDIERCFSGSGLVK